MADYSEQPSKIENPQDINQYIRGELFILMDSILQYNQSLIPEDLILCKDVLERYTLFFVQYIKTLPEFLVEYIEGKNLHQNMQIVSKKVAFGSAFHELFQTIIKIFNIQISKIYSSQYQPYDDSRFYKFYTSNQFQSAQYEKMFVSKTKETNSQVANFINYFGNLEGFSVLMKLITWKQESSNPAVVYRVPIYVLKYTLDLLDGLYYILDKEFSKTYYQNIVTEILKRFGQISLLELKHLDVNCALHILRNQLHRMEKLFGQDIINMSESLELEFLFKLIKSEQLEKKIKGITDMVSFVSNIYRSDGMFMYS